MFQTTRHLCLSIRALLAVGETKREIPPLKKGNVEVRSALDEALACQNAREDDPKLAIDFSPIGYTENCATAAVFVYSRTCWGEGYSILEMKRDKDWKVTYRHSLYARGE